MKLVIAFWLIFHRRNGDTFSGNLKGAREDAEKMKFETIFNWFVNIVFIIPFYISVYHSFYGMQR